MSLPTFMPGAGAGSGAQAGPVTGTNQAGVINFVAGFAPVPGAPVGVVTFGQAFGVPPVAVVLSPANAEAALVILLADPVLTKTSDFTIVAATTALLKAGVAYAYYFAATLGD